MKKKFIVLTSLLILSLAAVVFAYNRSQTPESVSASCPMHQQTASTAGEKNSCCGMADCCKDGKCSTGGACCQSKDSCPMKNESKADGAMNMSQVSFVVGESCCQKGAACCQGGACCRKN